MKQKRILIGAAIVAAIAVLWYYLRGGYSGPTQTSYPNANASGLPAYQSGGVAYNFGNVQPAPDPSLIYGDPPPLPPTPSYQRFNYSPLSIFNLTPEAAQAIPAKAPVGTSAAPGAPGSSPGCGCGCPNTNAPVFQDGNLDVTVAANPSEQIMAAPDHSLFQKLQFNLSTSVAADPTFTWGQTAKAIGSLPEMF